MHPGRFLNDVFDLQESFHKVRLFLHRHGLGTKKSRRLILVGATGSGKSATGNSILGIDAFETEFGSESVTSDCVVEHNVRFRGTRNERILTVVDTPGLKDTRYSFADLGVNIFSSIIAADPGPHAFLIVIQLGRYSADDENSVSLLEMLFEEQFFKHSLIVFTHKDNLLRSKRSEKDALNNNALQTLLTKCERRYVFFDNTEPCERAAHVLELMKLVDALTDNGKHFAWFERLRMKRSVMQKVKKTSKELLDLRDVIEQYKIHLKDAVNNDQKFTSMQMVVSASVITTTVVGIGFGPIAAIAFAGVVCGGTLLTANLS